MSYSFECIPRLVWGCGAGGYGDKDAKNKAIALMQETELIFVDDSDIHDYEKYHGCQILKDADSLPVLYRFGYVAHAIPARIVIKMLKDFKLDYFSGFMLRDYNLCDEETKNRLHIANAKNEHLILDFDGLVYGKSCSTDHCYD